MNRASSEEVHRLWSAAAGARELQRYEWTLEDSWSPAPQLHSQQSSLSSVLGRLCTDSEPTQYKATHAGISGIVASIHTIVGG